MQLQSLLVRGRLAGSDAIHLEPGGSPTAWMTRHGCGHASTGLSGSMPSAHRQLDLTAGQKGRQHAEEAAVGTRCRQCLATQAHPTRKSSCQSNCCNLWAPHVAFSRQQMAPGLQPMMTAPPMPPPWTLVHPAAKWHPNRPSARGHTQPRPSPPALQAPPPWTLVHPAAKWHRNRSSARGHTQSRPSPPALQAPPPWTRVHPAANWHRNRSSARGHTQPGPSNSPKNGVYPLGSPWLEATAP